MKASFKSDTKSVIDSANNLEIELSKLKAQSLKGELKQLDELNSTVKLIEKQPIFQTR